jgi:hypothetical protein
VAAPLGSVAGDIRVIPAFSKETQTGMKRLSMDSQAPRNKQKRQPAGPYGTRPLALFRPNGLSPLSAARLYLTNDLRARWIGEGRLGSRLQLPAVAAGNGSSQKASMKDAFSHRPMGVQTTWVLTISV